MLICTLLLGMIPSAVFAQNNNNQNHEKKNVTVTDGVYKDERQINTKNELNRLEIKNMKNIKTDRFIIKYKK